MCPLIFSEMEGSGRPAGGINLIKLNKSTKKEETCRTVSEEEVFFPIWGRLPQTAAAKWNKVPQSLYHQITTYNYFQLEPEITLRFFSFSLSSYKLALLFLYPF